MNANQVTTIAAHIGLDVPPDWHGVDAVWSLLEKMRGEGAIVIVKLDGERRAPDDTGPYTVLASGAPLGGDAIRIDARTIEEALIYLICRYASRVWGIPPGPNGASLTVVGP